MLDYPAAEQAPSTLSGQMMVNPTLRENIASKIKYHEQQIERLKSIQEKVPQLLDINLSDLREAMRIGL